MQEWQWAPPPVATTKRLWAGSGNLLSAQVVSLPARPCTCHVSSVPTRRIRLQIRRITPQHGFERGVDEFRLTKSDFQINRPSNRSYSPCRRTGTSIRLPPARVLGCQRAQATSTCVSRLQLGSGRHLAPPRPLGSGRHLALSPTIGLREAAPPSHRRRCKTAHAAGPWAAGGGNWGAGQQARVSSVVPVLRVSCSRRRDPSLLTRSR